ncbi:DUF3560 domain-containing protein [Pseudaquabacterium terrae]|nr:DUF3560 domain-containing protein [Aquabacterium terrae]
MWSPIRADLLLELCGEIGDEDTSLVDRADARADRFDGYSDRRGREADAARRAVAAITEHIPLGQPILIGHHSERHARKDQERIQNGMRKAVRLWETSTYWQERAAGALRHAKYKERADVRHRRIKIIEADKRRQERLVEERQTLTKLWQREGLTRDQALTIANHEHIHRCFPLADYPRTPPASQYEGQMGLWSALEDQIITVEQARAIALASHPPTIAWAQRWIEHYDHRLTYERAMLGEQLGTTGKTFDLQPGGRVLVQGIWSTIVRVNRKDGQPVSISTNRRGRVFGAELVADYQAPTAEEVALVKEVTKLPPLVNYAGEGVPTITQAQWNKIPKDYKGMERRAATDTAGAHRVRVALGSYVLGDEKDSNKRYAYARVFISDAKQVAPPAPNVDAAARPALPAPERVATAAPPQAAAPRAPAELNAMRDQLRQGVQVVTVPQLFPTPAHLARRMVELAEVRPGHRVLEPSAGSGALLRAIEAVTGCAAACTAIEVHPAASQVLRLNHREVTVHQRDFLACTVEQLGRFDVVLMNPPFADAADIKHIEHAATFVKPGGTLVAICAGGPRQHATLKPMVEHHGGTWEPLPAGTFEEAGTNANTVLLSFTVPVDETATA